MGEDAARADQSSSTLPAPANSESSTPPVVDTQDVFIPSSSPTSPTHTLTRLSGKTPTSPTGTGTQVSAITVVALLDQLVVMIEAVQENQRRMEKRQADLEGTVRAVQADLTRLGKNHTVTSAGVNKLLERSRKTGIYVKEVRERLDRQSGQVKRLEANHSHLLKRNHFKVLIFQEDNEIPTSVFSKESTADIASASAHDEGGASTRASMIDPNYSQEEGLQTISLSSDEEEGAASPPFGGTLTREMHDDEFPGPASDRLEWSRTDKFKRSSLKKVDSLKKAFSRSSIEKKINKIVPPERREKIMKSFSPGHPKSPTSKSSSFHVSPMTFNVKKVRDGEGAAPLAESENSATVEVPPMGGPDGQLPMAEVHTEAEVINGKEHSPSFTGSADGGVSVTEDVELDNGPSDKVVEEEVLEEPNESTNAHHDAHENGGHNVGDEEEDKSMSAPESSLSAAVAIQQAS